MHFATTCVFCYAQGQHMTKSNAIRIHPPPPKKKPFCFNTNPVYYIIEKVSFQRNNEITRPHKR